MTFQTKDWVTEETITEVDLDQGEANDDHLRVEADYKSIIAGGNCTIQGYTDDEDAPFTAQLLIDGSTFAGFELHESSGDFTASDIDVSNLTVALHILTVRMVCPSGTRDFDFRFFRTPDLVKISYWLTLASRSAGYSNNDDNNYAYYRAQEITAIGHLLTKFFS